MTRRLFVISLLLLATFGYLTRKSTAEPVPIRETLATLPYEIGQWHGRREPDYEDKIVQVLGVDEYARRTYRAPRQGWISLYIGYYASQRQGNTMHSPLNCLPGAGWTPTRQARTTLLVRERPDADATRSITINDFLIEKGLEREIVLYWYQSHDRVIASEYWGRIYTVVDAINRNRTDAAFIRIVVPVYGDSSTAISDAERRGHEFAQALFPYLGGHLPS
jgi:EpsI family protein